LGDPLPKETEQPEIDFNTQEEFDFVFDLGLAPDFEIELSKDIKINYYNIAVTDQMIEDQIKSYQQRFGRYEEEETVEETICCEAMLLNGKWRGRKTECRFWTPCLHLPTSPTLNKKHCF
jgi:trigger factor